jgi:hypothetical protein
LARTNQTIDPRSTDCDGSKPSKTDRSDPKRPGKCPETSDPNSLAAIYDV